MPDLGSLSWEQFFIILVAVALFDLVTGLIGALRTGTFDAAAVLTVLDTHIMKRAVPIGLLFAIGQVGNATALTGVAVAALAAYIAETVLSSAQNITAKPVAP